jgi:nucleoid DNA-binding protein
MTNFLIFVFTDKSSTLDITAYIRELLFGHDCVIVPGFGGFIGNYTPACIDKNSGTFFPPVKQISFNRNLNHNDGLLVGRISESAKMNYADVRILVEEFVNDVRKKLSKGEKVVFENIGSFINNHEGNVQFEPDKNANYHLDSYGLTSFHVAPLEGYAVREKVLKYKDREPVRQASIRKILWRAAVIIPLLTALIVVPLTTDIFKTKTGSANFNPLANIEFENNRKAVDNSKSPDSILYPDKATVTLKPESSVPVKEEIVLPVEGGKDIFCLIAGSFKSETNASLFIKRLEAEGYKPELLNGPNGFFRVSARRCSDLTEAAKIKDSMSFKYPGTWVARVK